MTGRLDVSGGKLIRVLGEKSIRLGPTIRIKDGILEVLKEAELISSQNQCRCELCDSTRTDIQTLALAGMKE